jgi:hypothetical protein
MVNPGEYSERRFRRRRRAIKGAVLIFVCVVSPSPGWATACSQEINRTELSLEKARIENAFVPDMPESTYAKMHRQPTEETVANARAEAMQTAEQALIIARKQDAEGEEDECLTTMKIFTSPFAVR